MAKTLKTTFTKRERFALFLHLSRNVSAQNFKEQQQYDDLWRTLDLDAIQDLIKESPENLSPLDIDEETIAAELDKDDLAFLLAALGKPIPVILSRYTLPIRLRLTLERANTGLKAVPDNDDNEGV